MQVLSSLFIYTFFSPRLPPPNTRKMNILIVLTRCKLVKRRVRWFILDSSDKPLMVVIKGKSKRQASTAGLLMIPSDPTAQVLRTLCPSALSLKHKLRTPNYHQVIN